MIALRLMLLVVVVIVGAVNMAAAQKLVTGLTDETIRITSDFTGTDLVVFGTVLNPGELGPDKRRTLGNFDIVVTMTGPREEGVVRKKDRTVGIWINRESTRFGDIPSSYLIKSSRPLDRPKMQEALKRLRVGFDHVPMGNVLYSDATGGPASFREAIIRLKMKDNLYYEAIGVEVLEDNLFRATIRIPALIPVGVHQIRSYLFSNDTLVSHSAHAVTIRKTGFEQAMFNFSKEYGYIYGICCVLLAMLTGWLSSVIFRRD